MNSARGTSQGGASRGGANQGRGGSLTTQDHDTIRQWAEERGGQPASVERTERGEGAGLLRIDFPDRESDPELKHISWGQFFKKFDREHLVFLYQDKPRSYFNKFVSEGREKGSRSTSKRATGSRSGNGRGNGSRADGGNGRGGNGNGGTARGNGSRAMGSRGQEGQEEERPSRSRGGRASSGRPTRAGTRGRRASTRSRAGGERRVSTAMGERGNSRGGSAGRRTTTEARRKG